MPIYSSLVLSQLCKLLENDLDLEFVGGRDGFTNDVIDGFTHHQPADSFSNTSVNFETFHKHYWRHFPEPLIKQLGALFDLDD